MTNCIDILNGRPPQAAYIPVLDLLGKVANFQFSDKGVAVNIDKEALASSNCDEATKVQAEAMMRVAKQLNDASLYLCLYSEIAAVRDGIRIVRPTVEQCEAMARARVSVAANHYRQPFPMLFYQLPADFLKSRGIDAAFKDISVFHLQKSGESRVWMTCPTYFATYDFSGRAPIEDQIRIQDEEYGCDWMDTPLYANHCLLERVCFNYSFLLTNYREEIPPKHYEKNKKLAKRRDKTGERARRLLNQSVFELAVPNHVQVWRRENGDHVRNADGMGADKRPHDRSGHWRFQAYGRRWEDHRYIFMPPMPINGGAPPGSTTIYSVKA